MVQKISKNFTTISLLKFALPSMVMMEIISFYTIIDGIFVARYVGSEALASLSIIYPVLGLQLAIGIMLATGGNAIVAKFLGEQNPKTARQIFSMIVSSGIIISLVITIITILFAEQICYFLGADDNLIVNSTIYLCTMMFFAVFCMLQVIYQSFFVTVGLPKLGLLLTIIAGLVNIFLDYLFIVVFGFGVMGAGVATGIGQMIPAIVGTIFFYKHKTILYFVNFTMNIKILMKACMNGASEMVSEISLSVTTALFNLILMSMVGTAGVTAITIILYMEFLFSALYFGFVIGIAPIFSYHLGANNKKELNSLYKICFKIIYVSAIAITVISFIGAPYIVSAFIDNNTKLYDLALTGYRLFSLTYLFNGANIYFSGLFTALSDGKSSAIISFSRTFCFTIILLLILPQFLGLNGVWLAVPLAELLTNILSFRLKKVKLEWLKV